jgi:hypothetical protein
MFPMCFPRLTRDELEDPVRRGISIKYLLTAHQRFPSVASLEGKSALIWCAQRECSVRLQAFSLGPPSLFSASAGSGHSLRVDAPSPQS